MIRVSCTELGIKDFFDLVRPQKHLFWATGISFRVHLTSEWDSTAKITIEKNLRKFLLSFFLLAYTQNKPHEADWPHCVTTKRYSQQLRLLLFRQNYSAY